MNGAGMVREQQPGLRKKAVAVDAAVRVLQQQPQE